MKFLMLFNEAYDGNIIYDLSKSINVHEMISSIQPTEIVVCIGPSQYTSCRRNMALSMGWSFGNDIKIYGFNILRHVINSNQCFYLKDKLIWIKNYDEYDVFRVNSIDYDLSNYVGNVELNGSSKFDCSIGNIWNIFENLKHELKQEYYDKFTNM